MSNYTHTVVVTIGRNVGISFPLSDLLWLNFKCSVHSLFNGPHCLVLQRPDMSGWVGDQVGEWEGKAEGAATFVALVNRKVIESIRLDLSKLAGQYEQDAIGFIVVEGTDHLVGP